MRIYSVLVLTLLIAASSFAQPTARLENAQKTLKDRLIRDTTSVTSVKFDSCRATIKIQGTSPFVWPSTGGVVGVSFPNDESSNSFSTGPDRVVFSGSSSPRYVVDFSLLSLSDVEITLGFRNKKLVMIVVPNAPAGAVIARNEDTVKAKYNPDKIFLMVKNKDADPTLEALRDLGKACK